MGKKKPFIDKKNSSTYHILHRSQRDVGGGDDDEDGVAGTEGGTILWPSPHNNKETDAKVLLGKQSGDSSDNDGSSKLKQFGNQLAQIGLVDDYDYEKHLKPIGGGDYFGSDGKRASDKADLRSKPIEEEMINEVDRQLESIALTAECMDDDIAHALFDDFDEGQYEELNDDFMLDADKEAEELDEKYGTSTAGDSSGDDGGFDFAAHVQKLMEKARLEAEGGALGELATIHEQGNKDKEFFSKAKPVGYDDDDDDDSGYFDENDLEIEGAPGVVPKLSEAAEKALCDKFAEMLLEYDSDDIGEGQDDDDVVGPLDINEDNPKLEAALDDFLLEKKDEIFMQGARHYMEGNETGGSGFSALVGTKMIPVKELDKMGESVPGSRDIQPIESILGEADDTLASGLAAPPAEEVFIDGKSYYSEKIRNPWDCETILTTYSNMDNNPTTIEAGGRRQRTKKKGKGTVAPVPESEEVQQIQLSEKTGLPIGVLPTRDDDEGDDGFDTYASVNKGEARKKKETAEEKKARKAAVKQERQLARMQKKMMKEVYAEEFSKRTHEVLVDDVGGKSVFRF